MGVGWSKKGQFQRDVIIEQPHLRPLRNFRYAPIYKSWWNSDLFDVALKKTGKQDESTYALRLLKWAANTPQQR